MLRLLIEDSEGNSKLAPITPESQEITIGRKAGNVIRLKERNVSREHAKIYQTDEGLFVAPVAARYGMKVNGTKIDGPVHIDLGDEIRIGDYRLYVQDESQEQPAKEEAPVDDTPVALPPDQQPRLVAISSNFAGKEYPVTSTKCPIGRATDSAICINHNSVSSHHAEITRMRDGNFEIHDVGSSNGTKVNGQDLGKDSYVLQSGDMIAFGVVITRFCAPGELWYFNFGSTEPKTNTGLFTALIIALIAVAVLGTVVVMSILSPKEPQKDPAEDAAVKKQLEEMQNQRELDNHIMSCNQEIQNGNFDSARDICKKAEAINPSDSRLIAAQNNLRREVKAENEYKSIKDNINEGSISSCRNALNAIQEFDINTYAYKLIMQENSRERAQECLEEALLEKGKNELADGDIASAEQTLSEMRKKGRSNSIYTEELADAIKAKKTPERPRSSGGSSRPKNPDSSSSAPAAPSDGGMSVDDLCALAVKAKIQKDNKAVCRYGKQALAKGGAGACKGMAKQYADACK